MALLLAGLALGVGAWVGVRMLAAPAVEPVAFAPEDGARAQKKIFDLARRASPGTVVLSEAELNAFVTRHLEPADLPMRDPVLRLRGDDVVEITGAVPLERLLRESPLAPLAEALPAAWLARPVWLTVQARASVATEPRRALRLDARRVVIGRQRVPSVALRLLLDPGSLRLTRIALPPDVQAVRVERGRVVIQTTSSRGRT
jgi:hypothetical protein